MRIWKSHSLASLINNYLIDSPSPSNVSEKLINWSNFLVWVSILLGVGLYVYMYIPIYYCDSSLSQGEINNFVQNVKLSYQDWLAFARNNEMGATVTWRNILSNSNYFSNTSQSFNTFFYLTGPSDIDSHAIFVSMKLSNHDYPPTYEQLEALDLQGKYRRLLSLSTVQLS